jgi:hypothetical protein
VDKLSGDELDNIIKQLAENSNNTAQYKEDYSKTAVEAAAVMYQGNSAV